MTGLNSIANSYYRTKKLIILEIVILRVLNHFFIMLTWMGVMWTVGDMENNFKLNKIISFTTYIGVPLSSLSLVITQQIGWRILHIIVGGVGVIFGIFGLIFMKNVEQTQQNIRQVLHSCKDLSVFLLLINIALIKNSVRKVCGYSFIFQNRSRLCHGFFLPYVFP
jgi:hypothetical protein